MAVDMRDRGPLLHLTLIFCLALAGCSAERNLGDNGGGNNNGDAGGENRMDGGTDAGVSGAGRDGSRADAERGQADAADANGGQDDAGGWQQYDSGPAVTFDSGLNECATVTREAEQIEIVTEEIVEVTVSEPIAMYLMLDKSGSMSGTPWDMAVYAINKFISATASENINIALQYFPLDSDSCDGSLYEQPAVSLGRLPDHANAITRSLAQTSPSGGTPTEGALNGLTSFCIKYKEDSTRNPQGEDCVGVLITDGAPTSCVTDTATLAAIAGNAYLNHSVMTFTMGMTGANFTVLNQIAEQGGTDCDPDGTNFACDVSGGTGDDILAALELIRDTITDTRVEERIEYQTEVLECEWEIPEPPPNEIFHREKVNVTLLEDETDETIFGRVPSADDCGDELGWYYDDPDNPTKIVACPKTCVTIQEAVNARIDIVLGCQTKVLVE